MRNKNQVRAEGSDGCACIMLTLQTVSSNYPPKLELLCEVFPGAWAQPVHLRVIKVRLGLSG